MRKATRRGPPRAARRIAQLLLALFAVSIITAPVAMAAAEGEGGEHAAPHTPKINWTEGLFDLSHHGKDADGGKLDPGDEPMSPPFVAVLINFAIFIALLVWKAGPPLTSYLNRRHGEVKGALEEAAKLQAEASELLADRQTKLGAVDREVDDLIEGMRTDAASEKKRMVADAETAAGALKRDADDRIAASITRARLAIEAEIVAAAIDAAEALIRDEGTDDDHNALVESFITSLTDGTFGGGPSTPSTDDSSVDDGWS